ncbi:hypothetical protein FRX31_024035 [Thalictrum thalictroides]|uniref:F-box domain-containing protein n=1 Tax=Thalictrum thalictroides TaxID=46969 RepID=A0A7J6VPT2_THATH|nr:hypothetical protein FRX31_024035 [Thalictrum thalictroides]
MASFSTQNPDIQENAQTMMDSNETTKQECQEDLISKLPEELPLLKNIVMASFSTQNPDIQENAQTMMDSNETTKQECQEDLISKLPEELLLHIVSNLNCHERILVETLSQRWKCFQSFPFTHLHLDENAFHRHRLGSKQNFTEFVHWVLENREVSGLKSVKLCCGFDYEKFLGSFLVKLLENPCDSLDLCLGSCDLPSWLMSSPQDGIYLMPTLNFSYLNRLRLENISMPLVDDLLYGFTFPVMEILELDNCEFASESEFFLSAPNLKTFRFSERYDDVSSVILHLSIPAITFLSMKDYFIGEKYRFLDPLMSLNDACIETGFSLAFNWQWADDYSLYALKLLKDLSHVRHLRLSAHVLEVISESSPIQNWELIIFGNLRSLSVGGWCTSGCFWSLIYLLMSCPYVEQFRLEMSEVDDEVPMFNDCSLKEAFEESKLYTDSDLVPLQKLQSVTLVSKDIGSFEFVMLKFLQQQGIGAEKITLCLD